MFYSQPQALIIDETTDTLTMVAKGVCNHCNNWLIFPYPYLKGSNNVLK